MNKTGKRLLTFFIGIPAVIGIVFCSYFNYLFLQVVVGVFSVLAANEFYNMLAPTKKLFSKPVVLILTGILPYITYLFILEGLSVEITPWFFLSEAIILMAIECFTAKSFENSASKIADSILIIFYCGFLITFITRLTICENAKYIISLFLLLVFICDSLAWFFGVLFGKSTRGIVACSPNKSLVGFIGGLLSSIATGILFRAVFPEIISISLLQMIILATLTAFSSIIGDLIESVFKRSCNVKDSGILIPGRGGVLDSIDSVLIASPVFYICYNFMFN